MKKIFSVLLITTIITTLGSPVYASSQNPSDLQECIENSMFYDNEYRLFNEFTYQGMEINLFPETTITTEVFEKCSLNHGKWGNIPKQNDDKFRNHKPCNLGKGNGKR